MSLRRREFIAGLGGAAVWPLAARAQQAGKLPTIGYLGTTLAYTPQWNAAFVRRLRELGWIEGRTVAIEYRWAEGRTERYPEIAAEFVRLKVDVIASSAAGAYAAKEATSVIPIVVLVTHDPIGTGLVASLARPGGNVTGLSAQHADTEAGRTVAQGCSRPPPIGNSRQCRRSRCRPRLTRSPTAAGTLGLESCDIANPASRGYRAGLRRSQGPRRRDECV
jgi:hypothetical protein